MCSTRRVNLGFDGGRLMLALTMTWLSARRLTSCSSNYTGRILVCSLRSLTTISSAAMFARLPPRVGRPGITERRTWEMLKRLGARPYLALSGDDSPIQVLITTITSSLLSNIKFAKPAAFWAATLALNTPRRSWFRWSRRYQPSLTIALLHGKAGRTCRAKRRPDAHFQEATVYNGKRPLHGRPSSSGVEIRSAV